MGDIKALSTSYEKDLIESLQKENEILKNRIMELSVARQISNEELICIEQIKILQNRSAQRELSLEEVKKLDYLVKNLRLITGQSSEKNSEAKFRDVTEAELVRIAASDLP